ncbi:helix-hairpin-helix domain-containing protein [Sphaerimonospora cavernae]|uniref:Helix-hairpin-helix domain-containing protein n=1 Tax=Sphaerimonospora cavernae TaxID=1740611 RepID=A0ABV6TYM1_9ACTN
MRSREQRAHRVTGNRAGESRAAETRLRVLIHPMAMEPPAARIRSSPMKPVASLTPPSFGVPEALDDVEPGGIPPPFRSRLVEIVDRWRSRGVKFGDEVPMLDPGGPGLRLLVLVGVLAAAIAGFVVWRTRPVAEPVAAPVPMSMGTGLASAAAEGVGPESAPPGSVRSAASPSPTSSVIVYVTGKVRKPGVLALPTGSRVVDAVEAAGGVKKGADPGGVNLARRLADGEHIVVGADKDAGGGGPLAAQPDGGGVVNLNTATVEQLNTLPGVGDVLAQRIIDFRNAHGGFGSVDQLRQVSGIGEKKFAELRDKVAV